MFLIFEKFENFQLTKIFEKFTIFTDKKFSTISKILKNLRFFSENLRFVFFFFSSTEGLYMEFADLIWQNK